MVLRLVPVPRYWGVLAGYNVLYGHNTKEDDPASLAKNRKPIRIVTLALAESFPAAHPRLELHKWQNLDIYLSKDEFHSVFSYPDRLEAVARIGLLWCVQAEFNLFFVPGIRFRDITTGNVLASYGCLMKRVSLSE